MNFFRVDIRKLRFHRSLLSSHEISERFGQEKTKGTKGQHYSQSSMRFGQSSLSSRDSERSARSLPSVWQVGQ
jgi:hypothetical protein